MRRISLSSAGVTAVAGGLLLAAGGVAAFGDDGKGSLRVLGYTQTEGWVQVTVSNVGTGVLTGTVVVTVLIDGDRTMAHVPFTVSVGQKAFVSWAAPVPGARIIDAGIIVDDGAPI